MHGRKCHYYAKFNKTPQRRKCATAPTAFRADTEGPMRLTRSCFAPLPAAWMDSCGAGSTRHAPRLGCHSDPAPGRLPPKTMHSPRFARVSLLLTSPLEGSTPYRAERIKGGFMLTTVLIVVLLFMLIGALPRWSHSRQWGYYPSGGLGVVLAILIILMLVGRL
jgi:hypothetical protein